MRFVCRVFAAWLFAVTLAPQVPLCAAPLTGISPPPGSLLTLRFADLPPTLQAQADGSDAEPRATLFFPENYTFERDFPLFIWNGGGTGGDGSNLGWPRFMTGERDFVILSVPLWKAEFQPSDFTGDPDVEGDENWGAIVLRDADAAVNWCALRQVLDEVFASVPNLDRSKVFIGGFSNGAHLAAILLNDPAIPLTDVAQGFVLAEGGDRLRRFAALGGRPALVMQGGESHGGQWMDGLRDGLEDAGADVTYVKMEGAGHAIPENYARQVGVWLRKQAGPETEK